VRRTLPNPKPDDTIATLHNFGVLQFQRQQDAAAEATIREEVALIRKLYGDENLRLADALKTLSVIQSRRGDHDGAIRSQLDSVAMAAKLLAADSPELAFLQADLGASLIAAERWSDAEAPLLSATATLLRAVGVGHQETVYSHYRLALVLARRGELEQAEKTLRLVADATGENLKEGARYEWMRYAVNSLLGAIQLQMGRLADAQPNIADSAEALLRLAPKLGVRTRATIVGDALDRCVKLYETLGASEAKPEYAQALSEWQKRRDEFRAASAPAAKNP
jgi:tetratricopeptide (TPR) repeat protein